MSVGYAGQPYPREAAEPQSTMTFAALCFATLAPPSRAGADQHPHSLAEATSSGNASAVRVTVAAATPSAGASRTWRLRGDNAPSALSKTAVNLKHFQHRLRKSCPPRGKIACLYSRQARTKSLSERHKTRCHNLRMPTPAHSLVRITHAGLPHGEPIRLLKRFRPSAIIILLFELPACVFPSRAVSIFSLKN